ncbi:MAG: ROK family protein [Bryobacteraceae bacterium]
MRHTHTTLDRDRHVIEAVVRRFGPISRAQICQMTDLRPSTTSILVRELIETGQLVECGRSGNATGRKQVLLRLNEEFRYIAGIDFDDETISAGIMDLHPRVRATVSEPIRMEGGRDGLVRQLISSVRRALAKAKLKPSSLLGIGIADPGLVDTRRGITIFSSMIEFWRDVPLRQIFEKEFGVPALVEMRTRAKTVAERLLGSGEMRENMIYVDYGSGIGAGILVDGKLLFGEGYGAGEFGHTHVSEDGPVCKCGSYGCLEAIAGLRAVEVKIRKLLSEGASSRALEMADGDPSRISGWTVLRAAQMGDKACTNILAEISGYLGLGLANLVNLFNPSMVVLDQRLALAGDGLLNQIVQIIRRQALTYASESLAVRFGRLGDDAGLLGIGLLILDRHFEIPVLKPPRFLIEPELAKAHVVED